MLTPDQEKWLNHLRDDDVITIHPYNPKVQEIFWELKNELQAILGSEPEILHRGASSMGISGKGELDIYIPVDFDNFARTVGALRNVFGEPGSLYPQERARFNRKVKGFLAEIFVINKNSKSWKNVVQFEDYLKSNPSALSEYAQLKESLQGVSTQEYYRKKTDFFNDILLKNNT